MGEDKDWLDTSKYIDSISIDFDRDYLSKHFLDLYQLKIKSQVIIKELPKFKNTMNVRSTNWQKRVEEEYEIFNILKGRYIERIGFAVFNDLKAVDSKSRKWIAMYYRSKQSRGMNVNVTLSLTYPRTFPTALRNVGDRHLTPGAKCFGDLKTRWARDGSMGIPHFLVIIGYYFAIEKQSLRV
jgi:hypothetical protein